ncbi:MAG: PD-(D/E)XK nuclease family protein [Vicingus serpentipes]|nr:PD-(D/E)XK nuclease family protein [Vicingus serpentipes]
MEKFLKKTAAHLINTYGDGLSDVCIVLPNKRAGLFLKQHLSELIQRPVWLPEILGAEELIEQLSDVEIIDNVVQLFELYAVYKTTLKTPESFDEFSKWGQILLHDFNEIDRYIIPTENLFNHINEARALEVWNLGEGPITDFELKYLQFWKQLGDIYIAFKKHLEQKNWAYQGMAFRAVAEQIEQNPEQFIKEKVSWNNVIFIGFNALNKAEETIISTLKKQNKAEVLWDADSYYLNDPIQESGLFLRSFQKKEVFTPFNWISNQINTQDKKITVLGIPQNIGQAKYMTHLIHQIDGKNNYKDTAIVLADENLLVPVLQSIPKQVENINVTMGYPLKNTPLNNFFDIYLTTLLNAERFGSKGQLTYHYKDIMKLLQLPFSKVIFGKEQVELVKKKIVTHNWVFINKEKLSFVNEHLVIDLPVKYDVTNALESCLSFIERGKSIYVADKKTNQSADLELEYLFQFAKLFNQLVTLLQQYPFIDNGKSLYTLYKQLLSAAAIELYGEPLKGLQVMGMLETRNIDFENVILTSANEGVLPAGKTFNSFIPFDIKKAYQLPTHVEKDAVYAYHFYRLIQHAKNITILYNTETNEFGSGEQSRFVTQIENELAGKTNISFSKKLVTYPTTIHQNTNKEVQKTPEIKQRILELFQKGISPTALNSYINCPLDFYYKYILGIKEVDEVEETIDHSSFGTYIHKVLEILYQNFKGRELVVKDLKAMLKLVAPTTHQVFAKDFSEKELKSGKNLLTFNVALNYVTTFIKNEIKVIEQLPTPLMIKALESSLESSLLVEDNGKQVTINLKGFADRIDAYGNTLRIIDYKTGLTEPNDLKIVDVEELLQPHKKNKAFQVLMYAYLYTKENELSNTNLHSGVVSFRKLSNGFMPFLFASDKGINQELLNDFENLLKQIILELLDVSVPFQHQSEALYCGFCG